jgi:hypothetical protein
MTKTKLEKVPFFNIKAHIPLIKFDWASDGVWWVTNKSGGRYVGLIAMCIVTPPEEDLSAICLIIGPISITFNTPWLSDLLLEMLPETDHMSSESEANHKH